MVMVTAAPTGPVAFPAARADLCLAYANTLYWRGREPQTETLHTLDDVVNWSVTEAGLDADFVEAFRAGWATRPSKTKAAFDEAIVLRETIYRIFAAMASGAAPAPADLARFNRALAQAPARAQLRRIGDGYAWEVDKLRRTVPALLAPVLWSAGDLLVRPERRRVRLCANEKCLWLFLDDSKSGTRRWCAMSACGNRAKARRHYLRRKQG